MLDTTIPARDDGRGLRNFLMPPKVCVHQRLSGHEDVRWRQAGTGRAPAGKPDLATREMPAGGFYIFDDGVCHSHRGLGGAACFGLAG